MGSIQSNKIQYSQINSNQIQSSPSPVFLLVPLLPSPSFLCRLWALFLAVRKHLRHVKLETSRFVLVFVSPPVLRFVLNNNSNSPLARDPRRPIFVSFFISSVFVNTKRFNRDLWRRAAAWAEQHGNWENSGQFYLRLPSFHLSSFYCLLSPTCWPGLSVYLRFGCSRLLNPLN